MAIAHDLGFASDLDVYCSTETFTFMGGHRHLRGRNWSCVDWLQVVPDADPPERSVVCTEKQSEPIRVSAEDQQLELPNAGPFAGCGLHRRRLRNSSEWE